MAGEDASLYDRLGGEPVIEKMIDDFYEKVVADPELGPFFKDSPVDRIRNMQREFFSQALGGPLQYTGRSLQHVHSGRGIKIKHFQRFVELLLTTLEEMGVPEAEIQEVISRVNVDVNKITGESNVDG